MKGYHIVYEPEAVATESPSSSIREEWKRKVRICAGSFQAFHYLPQLWNPFRYGWLSIQFLSHRFLRWAVVPFLIPVMILLTGMLALQSPGYTILFIFEVIFLIVSALGILLADRYTIPNVLLIPGYVLMMNAAAYAGCRDIFEEHRAPSGKNLKDRCRSVYPSLDGRVSLKIPFAIISWKVYLYFHLRVQYRCLPMYPVSTGYC